MKSMKKLVLVGLVLLASVMTLAGCKNDSVPETPKFTVTFETDHGTAPKDLVVESGTKLTEEQLPSLADTDDYIFEGWQVKGTTTLVQAGFEVTKNVTWVAKWRDRGTTESVTFSPENGTKFYYGEKVTVSLSSTTEGATIKYKLDDGEWRDYSSPIDIPSQNTITAYAIKEGLKDSEKTSAKYLRELTSITPPARTVYSVGEKFDSTGMVVTAKYDDGMERQVEGKITSDTSRLTDTAGINKTVTVSYAEGEKTVTAIFTVDVANYKFTETVQDVESDYTGTASATSTPKVDNPVYKKFGDWPQTIKGDSIDIGSNTLTRGGFDYHVGSDGNYYVKHNSDYYKVEPIVWRVLTENYLVPDENGQPVESGNSLLLAEKILTGGIKWDDYKNNYKESNIRKWLNGNKDSELKSDYEEGNGFLQTAFTEEAQQLIESTQVDNSARSTNPNSNASQWNSGNNQHACTNTSDKIFLLSEQEATMSDYGFAEYTASGQGNTRIRVTTDYAQATGAYQDSTAGYGGWWWLRSPGYTYDFYARRIDYVGDASILSFVDDIEMGVVPALSISMNGN